MRLLSCFLQILKSISTHTSIFLGKKSLKIGIIFSLTVFLIFFSGLHSYAQTQVAAVVRNVVFGNGDHSDFILQSGDLRPDLIANIPENRRRIENRGQLSVPNDGESQASFRFERQTDNGQTMEHGGLVIQTRPSQRTDPSTTIYRYPCEFSGQMIIAWRSNSNARTCDNEENGKIEIVTDPLNLLSETQSDVSVSRKNVVTVSKQVTQDSPSANLSVRPGSGATVIRTTAKSYREYKDVLVRCDRDFSGDHCWQRIPQEKESIGIEVLEGDVLVESQQNSSGIRVREGQKYSYPAETLESFSVSNAAMECETLKFLNPAYLIDSNTSQNVANGVIQQLYDHRNELGVAGQPPENLAPLETELFRELNELRSNPNIYADLIEGQSRFYYENWLRLPGEELDPNRRKQAVDEAITFLRSQKTLPPFQISIGLSAASREHVNGQGKTGQNFGHTSDNGEGYWHRIRRYGTPACGMNENVSYFDPRIANNVQTTAQVALVELLVDDGQRQAGSRENLFDPDLQVVGVACGPHGNFLREMCDITYANGYLEN